MACISLAIPVVLGQKQLRQLQRETTNKIDMRIRNAVNASRNAQYISNKYKRELKESIERHRKQMDKFWKQSDKFIARTEALATQCAIITVVQKCIRKF